MAKATLASPAGILSASWTFFRKHRALSAVLFWLLFLPQALRNALYDPQAPSPVVLTAYRQWELSEFLGILASFALGIVVIWGEVSVLVVGKRMIQSKAGRTRSSFRSVRHEALPLVAPLILTFLLQCCFVAYRALLFVIPVTALVLTTSGGLPHLPVDIRDLIAAYPWSPALLLLLIPALAYYLKTFFFDVALVTEGVAYRDALRRSRELVEGKFFPIMSRLFAIVCGTMLPALLLQAALNRATEAADFAVRMTGMIASTAVLSFASLLFLLSCVGLFGSVRNMREVPRK